MYDSIGEAIAIARIEAGLTQEVAAEKLHIHPRTISAYENNRNPIPDDVAFDMVRVYDALWLGYEWLRLNFRTGGCVLPELMPRELPGNILDLQVEVGHVVDMQPIMAEIGRDNQIDSKELPQWMQCIEHVKHTIRSGFAMIMYPIDNKKTALLRRQ